MKVGKRFMRGLDRVANFFEKRLDGPVQYRRERNKRMIEENFGSVDRYMKLKNATNKAFKGRR